MVPENGGMSVKEGKFYTAVCCPIKFKICGTVTLPAVLRVHDPGSLTCRD